MTRITTDMKRSGMDAGCCSLIRALVFSIGMALGGLGLAAIVLGGLSALALSSRAYGQQGADHGHENFWIAKGEYLAGDGSEVHCCGENDCSTYPLQQTKVHSDGSIDLLHADGSLWLTVPANEVQQSEDHDAWVCRRPSPPPGMSPVRCFFYPMGGM